MTDKIVQAHDMSDVLEMAVKCNLIGNTASNDVQFIEQLTAFANLIRADEREQCAKICAQYRYGEKLAKSIRERGE